MSWWSLGLRSLFKSIKSVKTSNSRRRESLCDRALKKLKTFPIHFPYFVIARLRPIIPQQMEDPLDRASDGEDDVYYDSEEDVHDEWSQKLEKDENNDKSDYEIFSQEDIQQRQEQVVSRVSSVLSLSRPEAVILLEHFNWSFIKVNENWFEDEERVRKIVGLVQSHPQQKEDSGSLPEMTCGICYESYNLERTKSASSCGHFFCNTCWTEYIHTAIEDGPGCLTLRCAHPSCSAALREDMVLSLVSQQEGAKYRRYRLRAFVENRTSTKWCPAPGCEYAVDYIHGHRADSLSILCKCSHKFCWNCLEEDHRPADCETVAKWFLRHGSESENVNWILANSKACPKCKRPIQKSYGCLHMTCQPPCKFEFCWLCLGAWTDHSQETGGNEACNLIDEAVRQGQHDEAQQRKRRAETSLDRYTHFCERWTAIESSYRKAREDLAQMQAVKMDKLYEQQYQTMSELQFLPKAWLQIVECLRVLKWTYAHRYISDHDQMIRLLQEDAERHLERLRQCAEQELQQFLDSEDMQTKFNEYRIKLVKLTKSADDCFRHFVQYVENGRDQRYGKTSDQGASTSQNIGPIIPRSKRGRSKTP